jgi:hypothetical protein
VLGVAVGALGPRKETNAMIHVIPRSSSRKVNGYVKAVLALEAVRRKREDRYERGVRPLDRRHDKLAAEVATRLRALSGGQLAAAQRLLAMIAQATAGDGLANRGVMRSGSTSITPPSEVGPRPAAENGPGPPRRRLRSRGAPARLEPRGLLRREDQPVDPSVTHRVRGVPTGVPAVEARLARGAIEREDPLLAVPVLEVADVEVGGLGAERRRDPARRGMAVVDRQHRH